MKIFICLLALYSSFAQPDIFNKYDNEYLDLINHQPINSESQQIIEKQNVDMQYRISQGDSICNILEFSGIGSFTGLTVGLGSKLRQQGFLNKTYDAVAGSSGGAINAMIIGKFDNVDKGFYVMRGFWSSIQNKFIYTNESDNFSKDWGFLNNAPLQQTITNLDKLTGQQYYRNVYTNIVNLNQKSPQMYDMSNTTLNASTIISATMNMPLFFKRMLLNGDYVIDGSFYGYTMLEQILGEKQCDFINYDLITYNSINTKSIINSFEDYLNNLIYSLENRFIEINAVVNSKCSFPIGNINIFNLDGNYHYNQIERGMDFSNMSSIISQGITSSYTFKSIPFC